jgi:hypothetical protein
MAQSAISLPFTDKAVISTDATDSLTVRRAVERPRISLLLLLLFLSCHPSPQAEDLLLSLLLFVLF